MAPRILVAYATRKGSTAEVAAAIGRELEASGATVTVAEMAAVTSLADYDGVVIGAPVYMGKVIRDVAAFGSRFAGELRQIPVAGFVTGIAPVFPKTGEIAVFTGQLAEALAPARPVTVVMFAGRLDPAHLSFVERGLTTLIGAPAGDFRDWPAVAAWARELPAKLGL